MLSEQPSSDLTPPKAKRKKCLNGVNILLVDDSRAVAEAIRLMAIKSGARMRRADCMSSARRHLNMFRPDILIVDLALPDGSGQDLIGELGDLVDPTPAVLIISAAPEDEVEEAAKASHADGFLVKPIANLASFQQGVTQALDFNEGPAVWQAEDYAPDITRSEALRHDYENMSDMIREAANDDCRDDMGFAVQFLLGVTGIAPDDELHKQVSELEARLHNGSPFDDTAKQVLVLLDRRIQKSWDKAN